MNASSPTPSMTLEPAWDVAYLFPPQGQWSEADYLALTDRTNRLVEFTEGRIEVLEMPTETHQLLVRRLQDLLRAFVEPRQLGMVLFAPLRVQVRQHKFREPDIVYMSTEHSHRRHDSYWEGADLVMEVVSDNPEARVRDVEQKRIDYAEALIPEYWIIDPSQMRVTVLRLTDGNYAVHAEVTGAGVVRSALLDGFQLEVSSIFPTIER